VQQGGQAKSYKGFPKYCVNRLRAWKGEGKGAGEGETRQLKIWGETLRKWGKTRACSAKQIKGCACKATVYPSILWEGARRGRAEHNALVFNPSRFPDSRFADSTLSPFLGRVESRSAGNAHNSRREPRNPVKGFLCVRGQCAPFLALFFSLLCFFFLFFFLSLCIISRDPR